MSTTVAGGIVVRTAGASELSPEAAAVQDLSDTVAGLGLSSRDSAIAAAGNDRDGTRASRDASRAALASVVGLTTQKASDVGSAVAAARLTAAAQQADAARKAEETRTAAAAAEAARKKVQRWVNPVAHYTLTSGFGWRWGRMHAAQDLGVPVGTPVHALSSGTVIFSGWSSEGYGYMVQIRYWDGTVSWYAHNSRLVVSIGEKVVPGQLVSYSGSTGNSTGPHLHLEIHPGGGASVPPRTWLAQKGVNL